MEEKTLAEAQRNNTRLLRKTFMLPEETFFQSLKRRLDMFVNNGIQLFHKLRQPPPSPLQPSDAMQQQGVAKEQKKFGSVYNFRNFIESEPQQEIQIQKIQARPGQENGSPVNKSVENNSKNVEEQQGQFEAHFKKGSKKLKKQTSSSFQQPPIKYEAITKEQQNFYESVNFSFFALQQKNLIEVTNKPQKQSESASSNQLYKEYLDYSIRNSSLLQKPQTNEYREVIRQPTRREHKSLRKKIQFQDQNHQLYDVTKVYEVFDQEVTRRQLQRQQALQRQLREQQQALERKRRQEEALRQKQEQQRLERQRQEEQRLERQRAEEQKLLQEQALLQLKRKQLQEGQKKATQNQSQVKPAQQQAKQQQSQIQIQSPFQKPKSPKQELPKEPLEPVLSPQDSPKEKPDIEKKENGQKQSPPHNPTTLGNQGSPQKNNPFMNTAKKQLGLLDLIGNQPPKTLSFTNNSISNPHKSSPSKSVTNIFNNNNQAPVNNIFGTLPKADTFTVSTPFPSFNNNFINQNSLLNSSQTFNNPNQNISFPNTSQTMFNINPPNSLTPSINSLQSASTDLKNNLFMQVNTQQAPSLFNNSGNGSTGGKQSKKGKHQVRVA